MQQIFRVLQPHLCWQGMRAIGLMQGRPPTSTCRTLQPRTFQYI